MTLLYFRFGYNSEAFRGRRIVLPDIATKIPKLALIPAPPAARKLIKSTRLLLPSISQQTKTTNPNVTLFLPTPPRCQKLQNNILESRLLKLAAFVTDASPVPDSIAASFKPPKRVLPKICSDGFESKIPRWDTNIQLK